MGRRRADFVADFLPTPQAPYSSCPPDTSEIVQVEIVRVRISLSVDASELFSKGEDANTKVKFIRPEPARRGDADVIYDTGAYRERKVWPDRTSSR